MRALIIFAVFVLAGASLSAFGDNHRRAETDREVGFDRDIYYFGGTYRTLITETPEQCARLCGGDLRCQAWSFIPSRENLAPRCELKRSGGLPEAQPQTVSGRSPRHEDLFANPPLHGLPPGASPALYDSELAGGPSL